VLTPRHVYIQFRSKATCGNHRGRFPPNVHCEVRTT